MVFPSGQSARNHDASKPAAEVDEEKEQLRSQIAAIQRENQALKQDLRALKQSAQAQTVKLEQAYAVLQAELSDRRRSERELQERLEIAHEQERTAQERATELAKANAALQESLRKLANEPELDKFLGHVLTVSAERFDAIGAGIWCWENNTGYLIANYEDGTVYMPDESSPPGAVRAIMQQKLGQSGEEFQRRFSKGEILTHYEEDFQRVPEFQSHAKRNQQQGIKGILAIPMFLGDSPRGCLALRFDHRRVLTTEEAELARALANQAMLALELTQLADEARQAEIAKLNEVIAREQEKAAEERAAELARANTALRRSIDALITQPSIESFLGVTLRAMAEVLEVPSACLWHFEGEVAYLRLLYHDGHVILGEHSNHVNAKFPSGAVKTYTTQPCLLHADDTTVDFADEHRAIFRQLGVRAVFCVPIVIGDCAVGSITARLTHEMADPAPARIELMNALANQAALALQMADLAESAKQAAIVREQEKAAQERAAELAMANAVLQESLRKLAKEPDLNKFLGHVMTVSAERFGAAGAGIWQFGEDIAHLIAFCKDGTVRLPDESLPPGTVPVLFSLKYTQQGRPQLIKGKVIARYKEDFQLVPEFQPILEWLQQQGIEPVNSILAIPMFFGESLGGALILYFDHRRTFTTEEAELAHALANQAMLALELTRLAESARQTAIAREQEKAAQEQAVELARANSALRQSIDALVAQPSIESFLGITLQAIADVLEVPSACLWHFEGELAYLQLVYQDGQVIPGEQSNHVNAKQPSSEVKPAWDAVKTFTTRPYLHAIGAPTVQYTDEQQAMFQQLGVRGVISAPIIIGDRAVGAITARLTHDMPDPSSARLELVNALANQAALALQMAELTEEAKQAVVLEERNRMAGEIHDTLAQAFTGISIQSKVAQKLMTTDPVGTQEVLDRIRALALNGLTEARRSVWALHSSADEYADLARNLQDCVCRFSDDFPTQIELEIVETPYPVSALVGQNLLRIAQEAIHNAIKHAEATQLRVKLTYELTAICLIIQDDGCGFEPNTNTGGFGLMSMSERVSRLNGQFTIQSQLGKGTEIAVKIPIK